MITRSRVHDAFRVTLDAAHRAGLDISTWTLREGLAAAGMHWCIDGPTPPLHIIDGSDNFIGLSQRDAYHNLCALTAAFNHVAATRENQS